MGESDRALGPEMTAERWFVTGGDWIMWMHPPSRRVVSVDGPIARASCKMAVYGDEPADPAEKGYCVALRKHDEHGNPYEGDAFWIASYGAAVRLARRIRQAVLDERPIAEASRQLTLDEMLAMAER